MTCGTVFGCGCTVYWDDHAGWALYFCDLHSAAPDLLAAGQRVIDAFDEADRHGAGRLTAEHLDDMRSAIAKAKRGDKKL